MFEKMQNFFAFGRLFFINLQTTCQDMLRFLHTTILTMCTAKMFKFGGKGRP
jgi:hypothetical protein